MTPMRIHRPLALLAVLLLAACGGPEETQSVEQKAADSAAVEAVTQPAEGVIPNVNERLDQADKDAAARTAEGMEQVREAEGASPP